MLTNTPCSLSPSVPSSLLDLSHLGQRGGAHVGALGEAEEHHHHLALEIGQRARLAVEVGQLSSLRVVGAGDVDGLELRLAARLAGSGHRRPPALARKAQQLSGDEQIGVQPWS
jgi:hypothetical protein